MHWRLAYKISNHNNSMKQWQRSPPMDVMNDGQKTISQRWTMNMAT
jgi:hypothetical protein